MEPDAKRMRLNPPIIYPANVKNRIIFVVEGQEFHVNKKMLYRQPGSLNALFSVNLEQIYPNAIELEDVNAGRFKEIMDKIHQNIMLKPEDFGFVPLKGYEDGGKAILTVEGQEFHIYKGAFSSRSTYFKKLFALHLPRDGDRVEFRDISALQFRRLLDFVLYGWSADDYGTMLFPSGRIYYTEEMRRRIREGSVLCCAFTRGIGKQKVDPVFHCGSDSDERTPLNESRKNHIKDYWKNNKEMLRMVERISIRKAFEEYFHRKLAHFACPTDDCFVCLTSYIFCLVHTKQILQLNKKYSPGLITQWFQLAKDIGICDERLHCIETMVLQAAKNRSTV